MKFFFASALILLITLCYSQVEVNIHDCEKHLKKSDFYKGIWMIYDFTDRFDKNHSQQEKDDISNLKVRLIDFTRYYIFKSQDFDVTRSEFPIYRSGDCKKNGVVIPCVNLEDNISNNQTKISDYLIPYKSQGEFDSAWQYIVEELVSDQGWEDAIPSKSNPDNSDPNGWSTAQPGNGNSTQTDQYGFVINPNETKKIIKYYDENDMIGFYLFCSMRLNERGERDFKAKFLSAAIFDEEKKLIREVFTLDLTNEKTKNALSHVGFNMEGMSFYEILNEGRFWAPLFGSSFIDVLVNEETNEKTHLLDNPELKLYARDWKLNFFKCYYDLSRE